MTKQEEMMNFTGNQGTVEWEYWDRLFARLKAEAQRPQTQICPKCGKEISSAWWRTCPYCGGAW